MSPRRSSAVAGSFVLVSALGVAAEIHVHPGQSIQAAIDAAANQDHVVVHPGIYFEALAFKGKTIVVRSVAGPGATTIDAAGTAKRGVSFTELETPATVLDGFTIRNGNGGILCQTSHPTIRNCVVRANSTTARGGGLFVTGGSVTIGPVIEDCVFENNSAGQGGGGVATQNKGITIRRCIVRGNEALGGSGGGGLFLQGSGTATVEDLLVEDNECPFNFGGGMTIGPISNARVTVRRTSVVRNRGITTGGVYVISTNPVGPNCLVELESVLVAGNDGDGITHAVNDDETKQYLRVVNATIHGNGGRGFHSWSPLVGSTASLRNGIVRDNAGTEVSGDPVVTFSNVQGGFAGLGNFDVDPLFVDAPFFDYHLRFDSPCIDIGSAPALGPLDLDGDPRVNGEAIDFGADEFHRRLYAQVTPTPDYSRVRINVLDEPGKAVLLIAGFSKPAAPLDTPFGSLLVGPPYVPIVFLGATPSSGWVMQRFDVRTDLGPFTVHAQALSGNALTNAIVIKLP